MNFCIMIFKSHPGSWYGCTHDEGKIKESEWRSPPKSEASANTRITLTRNIRRYFLRTDTEKVKMQLHMFEFEIQCCARRSLWGRSRENFAEIYFSNNNNDLYDRYIRKWEDSADTVNIFFADQRGNDRRKLHSVRHNDVSIGGKLFRLQFRKLKSCD